MLDGQRRLLENFDRRIKQLMSTTDVWRNRTSHLEDQLTQKELELQQAKDELKTLQAKYNNLKTAKQLSGDALGSKEALSRLNKLVREVDKCIELLKD